MKKVFLAIAVASVFTACNGGETETPKTDSPAVKIDTPVVAPVKMDSPVVKVDSPAVKKVDSPAVKK